MKDSLYIAWTTTETKADAERIANGLVEQGHAACVQVDGPVHSFFRWKGEVDSAEEFRLMAKIPAARLDAAEKWLHENHAYETPQWIAVEAGRVGKAYLDWACSP